MSPKDFKLRYEAVNKEGTFSEGDTITGIVSFTLTKDTKVECLTVKAKGDAHVHWSKGTGDDRRSYSAWRKLFKEKENVIAKKDSGTELREGAHSFTFKLKIPHTSLPSSFKGFHGRIVYQLEAKLSRKWRMSSRVHKDLNFVSKSFPQHVQAMIPQSGSVDKTVGSFSKGEVHMDATMDRKSCSPGGTVSVAAKINNMSSKTMKPKFSLQQRIVYHAECRTNVSDLSLCKMVGDTVTPKSKEIVTCQVKVPEDAVCTLHNCEIISVDYYIKVYLDISFAIDPTVDFPLVIVPSSFASYQPSDFGPGPAGAMGVPGYSDFGPGPAGAMGVPGYSHFGPGPAGAVGAPGYNNVASPAYPPAPYPVPSGPGAYGWPTQNPAQHGNMAYNQFPQQVAPYGFPTAYPAPSSVQHPPPTAPPLFQGGEQPPSYTSLYQPPDSSG